MAKEHTFLRERTSGECRTDTAQATFSGIALPEIGDTDVVFVVELRLRRG